MSRRHGGSCQCARSADISPTVTAESSFALVNGGRHVAARKSKPVPSALNPISYDEFQSDVGDLKGFDGKVAIPVGKHTVQAFAQDLHGNVSSADLWTVIVPIARGVPRGTIRGWDTGKVVAPTGTRVRDKVAVQTTGNRPRTVELWRAKRGDLVAPRDQVRLATTRLVP